MKAPAPRRSRTRIILGIASACILMAMTGCTQEGAWDALDTATAPPPDPEELFGPWRSRLEVTLDTSGLSGFLFDVPVPIVLDTERVRYNLLAADGSDIAFYQGTEPEPERLLSYERSRWDPLGESVFWVRVPVVAPGAPVTVSAFLGSDSIATEPEPADVWRNGYGVVMHFDDPDDPFRDSSPFGNHGLDLTTPVDGKTAPVPVSGRTGGAIDFENVTDAVVIEPSASVNNMRPFTLELTLRLRGYSSNPRFLSKGNRFLAGSNQGGQLKYQARVQHWVPAEGTRNYEGAGTPANWDLHDDVFSEAVLSSVGTDWVGLAWRWDGGKADASFTVIAADFRFPGDLRVHRSADYSVPDDQLGGSYPYSASDIEPDDDSATRLVIGNGEWDSAERRIDGVLDELRISLVDRSDEWLAFQRALLDGTAVSYAPLELLWDSEFLPASSTRR